MKTTFLLSCLLFFQTVYAQVTPNINSGNPKFPFPQFLDYGPDRKTLASVNAPGVTHAEMEQRTREAWQLICNNTSPYPNTIVSGVQYLYPTTPMSCTCAEGDGYYLLGAALMGDKPFFDGYYMWAHDRGFNGVKRFVDGLENRYGGYSKGLSYAGGFGAGTGVLGEGISGNSAADGDVDIALALLIAYKQWGENSGIILTGNGWAGKEINYKEEALSYIKAMVDTSIYAPALPNKNYITGIVGLDGYMKSGDSWGELTPWAVEGYKGMAPQLGSSGRHYIDYNAPAWFKAFRTFLEVENERPFLINQYKRGEASSDWLMGLHHSKGLKNIPYMGRVESLPGNDFEFSNYIPDGEDFRAPWRTVMNYVWHGNPTFTWNSTTHEPEENKPNTFEYEVGKRYAAFLKNNQDAPWNNPCIDGLSNTSITFKGPYTLLNGYTPEGSLNGGAYPLNWIHGAGAPSAIAGQDFELMGEMFRHCVIAWEAASGTNLSSRPKYFHDWFRLVGMLTLAGNFHSPNNMIPSANLKVYHKVDKTVAFKDELVTFTVSYRNYGSLNATGTTVKLGIPSGFEFLSATKGGVSVADSVLWNVGTVPGFTTAGAATTQDSMKVTFKVKAGASGRYCTSARIKCTNGSGWVSNEYPNTISSVMQRNCVDIRENELAIIKTSNVQIVNPAINGTVEYKLKFGNRGTGELLNGGRPGVRLSFAHDQLQTPTASNTNNLKFRLFHDAAEPYIDYGNYRVSYFINDPTFNCYSGNTGCPNGWSVINTIAEGISKSNVKISHQSLTPGTDTVGSWNQRLIFQFSPQLATITQHLLFYAGSPGSIHEGGTEALRGVWLLHTNTFNNINWADDWSWDPGLNDSDGGLYFPIGDDFTLPTDPGLPVTSWHKSACQTSTKTAKNLLVEEWDGYTWRRIYGNAPELISPVYNVTVTDTLPEGVTFLNFVKPDAFGITATTFTIEGGKTVVKWSIPSLTSGTMDSLVYTAAVTEACPSNDKELKANAWISATDKSAASSSSVITSSCTVTSTTMESTSKEGVRLFPNPSRDQFNVQLNSNSPTMALSIKDGKGNEVYAFKGGTSENIAIGSLANGVYVVEITTPENVLRTKLVVLK